MNFNFVLAGILCCFSGYFPLVGDHRPLALLGDGRSARDLVRCASRQPAPAAAAYSLHACRRSPDCLRSLAISRRTLTCPLSLCTTDCLLFRAGCLCDDAPPPLRLHDARRKRYRLTMYDCIVAYCGDADQMARTSCIVNNCRRLNRNK